MSNRCLPQLRACATRVARLDSNGVPSPGANNLYVTDALVSMGVTYVADEGETIEIPNACGNVWRFRDNQRYQGIDVTLQVRSPDPELAELLADGTVLSDGDAAGYALPELNTDVNPNGVSLELWVKQMVPGGGQDPDFPYARWVFPQVHLIMDEMTFENAALQPSFTGFAVENSNWFDGPLNDWNMDSDKAVQWIEDATIPTTSCGYQTLTAS